jgi:hypothetical protein
MFGGSGARAQPRHRLDDQRGGIGQAVGPHPLAVLARDDAETVVLDLVQPRVAGRRLRGLWRAGRANPGRKGMAGL